MLLTGTLSACGGGGGSNSEDSPVAQSREPSGRAQYVLVNTKPGAQTVSSDLSSPAFSSGNGSGAIRDASVGKSSLTVQCEATVDGRAVYKVSIFSLIETATPNPAITIHGLEGHRLFEGKRSSRDGSAYPTQLDLARPWTRR